MGKSICHIAYFCVVLLIVSCTKKEQTDNPVLAEVGNKKLLLKDITCFIPPNIKTQEDSMSYVNLEVEEWVRNQIVVNQGALSQSEQEEIELLIKNYRSNITLARIESNWIQENLDTIISAAIIDDYKKKHNDLFVVDEKLIRCTFARIKSNTEGLVDLDKKWNAGDLAFVKSFCKDNAINAHLNNDQWISVSQIKKQIPRDLFSDTIYEKKGYNQKSKGGNEYFLQVLGYKEKGELPKELVTERIKKIIIQQRKLELIKSFKSKLYKEAMNKNQIKTYLDKVK